MRMIHIDKCFNNQCVIIQLIIPFSRCSTHFIIGRHAQDFIGVIGSDINSLTGYFLNVERISGISQHLVEGSIT